MTKYYTFRKDDHFQKIYLLIDSSILNEETKTIDTTKCVLYIIYIIMREDLRNLKYLKKVKRRNGMTMLSGVTRTTVRYHQYIMVLIATSISARDKLK